MKPRSFSSQSASSAAPGRAVRALAAGVTSELLLEGSEQACIGRLVPVGSAHSCPSVAPRARAAPRRDPLPGPLAGVPRGTPSTSPFSLHGRHWAHDSTWRKRQNKERRLHYARPPVVLLEPACAKARVHRC